MTDDKLEFLENEAEESETEDAQPVEAEPEAQPVEAEAEEGEKQEEVEPPSATDEESEASDARSVPVVALLDEREKRQLAQQEAKESRQKLEQMERKLAEFEQRNQPQQKAPDFYEDPDKAIQYHNSQQQQQFVGEKLKMSKFLAEREYGAEVVSEAFEYFNQHPQESQALLNEPSPFHAAVDHYKRQQALSKIGNDPAAYEKQIEQRVREQIMAEMSASQPSKPNAPPPSMVKATAAGKDAIHQGTAFDNMFPD